MADVTTTTTLPANLQALLDRYWSTALNVGNSMMDPNDPNYRPMQPVDPSFQVPGPNWLQQETIPAAYNILNRTSPGMRTVDYGNQALQDTMSGAYYNRQTGTNPYEGLNVTPDKNPYAGSNPYLDAMIGKAQGDITDSFRSGTQANLKALAARANAFGGSGYNDATQRNEKTLADALGNISNQMRFQDYTTQQGLAESAINRAAANDQMNVERNARLADTRIGRDEASFQNERARTMQGAGQSPQMAAADIGAIAPAANVGSSMYDITRAQNQAQISNDLMTRYPEMYALDMWRGGAGMPMGTTTTQSGGGDTNRWGQIIGGLGTGWALGNMFNLW